MQDPAIIALLHPFLPAHSLSLHAACSSSLVSLHMAFNSLLVGQSSLAVNSGVNLALTPDTFAMFQASGKPGPRLASPICPQVYSY